MAQAITSQRHRGSSRPPRDTRDGFAAIDLGSTSTRAYLTTVDKKTKEISGCRVQKIGVDDYKIKRFLRGEWPSKGCPFDAPYPVGYDATDRDHADKRDRSLKSFVWFLADDDDQHPYTRDLKNHYDLLPGVEKSKFRQRLRDMLVRHLTIVADQIFQEAALRETTVRRLVFCVPNAWDKSNFQNVLRPVMDEVARGIDETYCVFESEALAQFILYQHPWLLKGYEFVLVCDFGGHFMGGSLFQFCKDGDADLRPAFFSLPQGNFGIRGGSQLWEDHIRPYIDAHLATLGLPADRESVLRAKFLDSFFVGKAEVDESFYTRNMPLRLFASITDVFPDDTNLYPLYLKPADILQAWQLGFRDAIDLALGKIRLLPVSSHRRTTVILSGGSMLNYQARAEIRQACDSLGIECKIMWLDVNPESGKWMVCEGAARAEASAISPRQFIKRGAAFAVQSFTRNGVNNITAKVLFRGGRQAPAHSRGSHLPGQLSQAEEDRGSPVEIELRDCAHDKVRLVCDPLYQRHRYLYSEGYISIYSDDAAAAENNCYDVWDISRHFEATLADGTHHTMRIPPGRYRLEADGIEYHRNSVDATLNLRMTQQVATAAAPGARKNLRARTLSTRQDTYTFELPLTACGSSNLVLLDLDQIKNRMWKPQQARIELQLSIPEPELELESSAEVRPADERQPTLTSSVEGLRGFDWDVAPEELFARPCQQGNKGVAGDSRGTPSLNLLFDMPGRSPSAAGTPIRTARSHRRDGQPWSGGRRNLTARLPKGKARVPPGKTNHIYGCTDSDSGSDSSDIPESSVNLIPPIGRTRN